ncbi:CAF17-like 4Fe-4S cluster assembly/insertion protein YgfZ [Gordonia sp. PP30]|uniref:CAF17-like 4Fe-4S cluster assembly/insertion protein YgfZ n=1 Tax=unclassified Gordonia (in: high G+C Gram-positive bacteria) TaxID=2657482 RepID=UPI001FFFF4FC|nr:folate-binding protein [Gordonia sp. PP30]UQE75712.1 folate-binding protein [Gordonia sp. PP30]
MAASDHSPILLSHPGAVPTPDDDPSPGVAWHYGDPLGEQRAAQRRAAVIDRSDRAVLELDGDDRLTWLHSIVTQDVASLRDRTSAESLSLDGNGRVEDHFVLTDVDGITWLDTEYARGGPLLEYLSRMVFRAAVTPVARPDMHVLTLIGPNVRTGPIAELLDIPASAQVYDAGDLPEVHHEDEPLGFWRIMPPTGEDRDLPVVDLVVPDTELALWWRELVGAGAAAAGVWAQEALRVAAMRPRLGLDTDERTIAHEADWIGTADEGGAVHLNKGCYRGQETVARVQNLGRPPRRLVLLHLDGSADERPALGDPVNLAGRAIGRIGTVIDHHDLGPIALALVKRTVAVDAELTVGAAGTAARIDPDYYTADDAVPAGRAAVNRLRGRD